MKELRISVFAYELLKELGKDQELQSLLKEFTDNSGTNYQLDYHYADITDENLLMAKLKHNDAFKYITVRDKQ
jgi:ABC-type phosphate transport system substrate-binding protein